MSESNFKFRCNKKFEEAGYLAMNVPMPKFGGHIIDTFLIRDGRVIPIEYKGKKTKYPKEQEKTQVRTFSACNTPFIVLRQGKKRGTFDIRCPNGNTKTDDIIMVKLLRILNPVRRYKL